MPRSHPNTLSEILESKKNILLTDGAARGNPGPSGWAYILLSGEKNKAYEGIGHVPNSTNNKMEMMGCLEGLAAVKKEELRNEIWLITDSNFLIDAITKWRRNWKKNGWKKSDGTDVLNVDIWQKIDPLADETKPHFVHIEAHKGHPGNTRCDLLAVAAATEKDEVLFSGTLDKYPHFKKIAFDKIYSTAKYLCWRGKTYKEFSLWPEAQHFMKENPSHRVRKIYSPEEIEQLLG